MTNQQVVLLSACRTPIGEYMGRLSGVPAPDLGALTASKAIEQAGVEPETVDEVIMGNVLSAGLGQAPARQVQLGADVPASSGALTVNKVCGSGLKAVVLAAQAIMLGDHDCVLAGGMESMSRVPHLLPDARRGLRFGDGEVIDSMIHDGLWDVYNDYHMGNTAELVAEECGVSREDQDQYALESHRKAVKAQEEGWFDEEIVPVETGTDREGNPEWVEEDERPRPDTSLDKLQSLPTVFEKDGTVTAGNASGISDGASSLVLASAEFAEKHGRTPLARLTGYATGGVEPKWVMMAPVNTIERHEEKTGISRDQYDLIEINEAFSAQGCALIDELDIPEEKLNVHGGAVALGHPIGCTGARILTTLVHALHQHDGERGLAALCLGGGNGVSVSVEVVQ